MGLFNFNSKKKAKIISTDFKFIDPILMLQNFISDKVLKDTLTFESEDPDIVELVDNDLKRKIKTIAKTIIETNVKIGVCYIFIDKNNELQILNPTWPTVVWKEAGKIVKIEATYRDGTQGLVSKPITITIDKTKVVDGQTIVWRHNLGFVPVIEIPLKKCYNFNAMGLNNTFHPYEYLDKMNEKNDYTSFEFDSVFKPLYAPAGEFHKIFNVVYSEFMKTIYTVAPRPVLTGLSARKLESLERSKKDESNEFILGNSILSVRGEDTKFNTWQYQGNIMELCNAINELFNLWLMKMGINYEGSNKGNNKTQSEIEAKTGLTDQTINQIRIAFESGIEALIEMYIKMTSLQETYKYKVEDVENKEFKFYLKPEISAQDVDSTIKLVQAQVWTAIEGRSYLNGTSLEYEKQKIANKEQIGEMTQASQPPLNSTNTQGANSSE